MVTLGGNGRFLYLVYVITGACVFIWHKICYLQDILVLLLTVFVSFGYIAVYRMMYAIRDKGNISQVARIDVVRRQAMAGNVL